MARTHIDVRGWKLIFEIRKENIKFDMFKAMKYPSNELMFTGLT
jgi:hypothetical protein